MTICKRIALNTHFSLHWFHVEITHPILVQSYKYLRWQESTFMFTPCFSSSFVPPHPILIRIYIKSSSKRCLGYVLEKVWRLHSMEESKGGLSLDSYPPHSSSCVFRLLPFVWKSTAGSTPRAAFHLSKPNVSMALLWLWAARHVHPFFHCNLLSATDILPVSLTAKDKLAKWGLWQRPHERTVEKGSKYEDLLSICQPYWNFI